MAIGTAPCACPLLWFESLEPFPTDSFTCTCNIVRPTLISSPSCSSTHNLAMFFFFTCARLSTYCCAKRSFIASAIPTARRAGSTTGSGSLKKIRMPSPAKRSIVPSCSEMILPSTLWYSRSTASTSSGSAESVKAVNPRRSTKT